MITANLVESVLASYRTNGQLATACKHAGISRSAFLKFLEGKSPLAEAAALNYEDARAEWGDVVLNEVTRRAIDGVKKDVYHQGVVVGTETVYSDSLLSQLAKATVDGFNTTQKVELQAAPELVIRTFGSKPDALD